MSDARDLSLASQGSAKHTGFAGKLGAQFRHPSGIAGRILGHAMGWFNAEPVREAVGSLHLAARDHVLEVGCGNGKAIQAMLRLTPHLRICAIDHSAAMVDQACARNRWAINERRVTILQGGVTDIPWPSLSFNKILLVNVIYFFDKGGGEMKQIFNLLKPGGRLVIYATDAETMRAWAFANHGSHNLFTARDITTMLCCAGFSEQHIAVRRMQLPLRVQGNIVTASRP